MKKTIKTLVALIMVCIFMFSNADAVFVLAQEDAGDDSTVLEDLTMSGGSGQEEAPDVFFDPGTQGLQPQENGSVSIVADGELINDRNVIESGNSELDFAPASVPEIDEDAPVDMEFALSANDFEEPGDTDTPLIDNDGSGGSMGDGFADIRVSSTSLSVNAGSSVKVTVTGSCAYASYKYKVSYNPSYVSCKWGKLSGGKAPLTITGKSTGTTTIRVSVLRGSDDKELDYQNVSVKIKDTVTISASKSSLNIVQGAKDTFSLSVSGDCEGMKLYGTKSNNNIAAGLKSNGSGKFTVEVNAVSVGSTALLFEVVDNYGKVRASTKVNVYIVANSKIKLSSSSMTVGLGETKSNTVTIQNFSGSGSVAFSIDNSNCVASWSGSWQNLSTQLKITGKKSGTSVVTVYLYSSDDKLLHSEKFTVTIKENAKLTLSVSSLSMKASESRKITCALSGYDSEFMLSFSCGSDKVFGCRWNEYWNSDGCSIGLNVIAKAVGSDKLTVSALDGKTKNVIATKTIDVSVSGEPSLSFSASSVACKVGEQTKVKVTVSDVSCAYSLSASLSGSAASCYWESSKIVNNSVNLIIKGAKEGSATVTVYLKKSSDNTEMAKKSLSISVTQQSSPTLSVSTSSLSLENGESGSVRVSWAGLNGVQATLTARYTPSVLNVSWGSVSNSSCPLNVKAVGTGSTKVEVLLVRKSDQKVLASKTIDVEISTSSSEVKDLSYYYENYTTYIEKSTFRAGFRDVTLADALYRAYSYSGGVCYGMSTTSLLFEYDKVKLSGFGRSSLQDLSPSDTNNSIGLTSKRFIELMQIGQFSSDFRMYEDLNALCNYIEDGEKCVVLIYGPEGGHALIGYKLDRTNDRLYVYDCNYPYSSYSPSTSIRYITLSENSSGQYVRWSYVLGPGMEWNSYNGGISYQRISHVNNLWTERGNWDTGVNGSYNYLITDAKDFTLYDVEDNVIATYSAGKLDTENENIYKIELTGYVPGVDYENPYDVFVMPVDYYTMGNDSENDTINAEMINSDYGVRVSTSAETISFAVDDSLKLCSTNLGLNAGDTYSISLLGSDIDGEHEFNGLSRCDDAVVSCSMNNNNLSYSADRATMSLNGVLEGTFEITASAGEGGSISSEGKTAVAEGEDMSYVITANKGYSIADVFVDGESIGAVDNYTFLSVKADADIYAVFEKNNDNTEEIVLGDVDGDGEIKANDARTALRMSVGLDVFDSESREFAAADINKDGKIAAGDARMILRASVGLEELK